MQTETHLCRSFNITVHEKALDGVGLGHNWFLHILLGVWPFSTHSSCKYFTKWYLSDKPFDIKRFSWLFKITETMQQDRCAPTAYLSYLLQCHRPNRHRRFLSRPPHIPFHLRKRIKSDHFTTPTWSWRGCWSGDSPSSTIQSSSCLSCTIFEYCCSSTSSYTLVTSFTWKTWALVSLSHRHQCWWIRPEWAVTEKQQQESLKYTETVIRAVFLCELRKVSDRSMKQKIPLHTKVFLKLKSCCGHFACAIT